MTGAPAADWFAVAVTRQRTFDSQQAVLLAGNSSLVPQTPVDNVEIGTRLLKVSWASGKWQTAGPVINV